MTEQTWLSLSEAFGFSLRVSVETLIRGPVGRRVSTATAAARGSWESDPPPRDNSDSGYTLKIHRQRTVLLVLDTRLQWLRIIGFGILLVSGISTNGIPLGGTVVEQPFAIGVSDSSYLYEFFDQAWKENMTKEESEQFVVGRQFHYPELLVRHPEDQWPCDATCMSNSIKQLF
ncbi:hypothetical protein F2Q69_00009476 [Brassica cretica]|uniref:Uncharacterized protein n=1 Tax=Brassica cretica TaxID=69181 RepID=A0A8S9NR43_BRACR|nr:hypothetical protein F2Q69_00009476 [Brassica cretica]